MRRLLRDVSERDIERYIDWADDQRLRELETEAGENEEDGDGKENPCAGCRYRSGRFCPPDCPLL